LTKFTTENSKRLGKGCGRNWLWYNLRYYPGTLLEGGGAEGNHVIFSQDIHWGISGTKQRSACLINMTAGLLPFRYKHSP
jgi:hypothetical protein